MSIKNPRIIKRNEAIRKQYIYYTEQKHFAVAYTLSLLEKEFIPLLADTIWLIISKTGYYKDY